MANDSLMETCLDVNFSHLNSDPCGVFHSLDILYCTLHIKLYPLPLTCFVFFFMIPVQSPISICVVLMISIIVN